MTTPVSPIRAAAEAIANALRAGTDLRVYPTVGTPITTPAAVIGPPTLEWAGTTSSPTNATFVIYLVVAMDDKAIARLWDLIPGVASAIDAATDAVVTSAAPGFFNAGTGELPCYEISVECSP